jgi:hypothetical protein
MSSKKKSELKYGGTKGKLDISRALHRATYLKRQISVGQLMQKLKPHEINAKAVADQVASIKIPAAPDQATGPLFKGTLYFVQITFTGGGNGAVSFDSADLGVAIQYASSAANPISKYANQYGTNSITVSNKPLSFSVDVSGNYGDSDVQAWVDQIVSDNNLTAGGSSCIVIMNDLNCPIQNKDANPQPPSNIGGYHQNTDQNNPYCFCNVFATPIDIADTQGAFAQVESHEIAEMTVDPLPIPTQKNPEVCDACAPNCGAAWNDYFDNSNTYLGSGTNPSIDFPGYAYFINSIVKESVTLDQQNGCPTDGSSQQADCAYAPH